MKKILSKLMLITMLLTSVSINAQSIQRLWTVSFDSFGGTLPFRYVNGYANTLFGADYTNGEIEEWKDGKLVATYDVNKFCKENDYPYTLGQCTMVDDKGNILVNVGTSIADPTVSQNWVLLPVHDRSAMQLLYIDQFPGSVTTGRVDIPINLVGDISTGAYMYITPHQSNELALMHIRLDENGKITYDLDKSWAFPISMALDNSSNVATFMSYESLKKAQKIDEVADQTFVRKRSNGVFTWDTSEKQFVQNSSIEKGASTPGMGVFEIDGVRYIVLPVLGENGVRNASFAIYNMATNEEVARWNSNCESNNSGIGSVIARANGDGTANIYVISQKDRFGIFVFNPLLQGGSEDDDKEDEIEYEGFYYKTTSETEVVLVQGETEAYYQSEITIPATVEHEGVTYTVTAIGDNAFSGRGLSSVTIPEGVTHIGENAFSSCWSLSVVTVLAKTPPTIHSNTFMGCSASLYVPEGCEEAYRNAEYWSWFPIYSEPGGGSEFEYEGFHYQTTSDTEVELVRGETEAYYQSEITIPATVEHEGVTYTVTAIGNEAFAWREISSVTIPECVTRIGENAFGECWNLSNITVLAQTPPTIYKSTFANWDATIYVPYGCVDTYRNAEHWSGFNNYEESATPGGGSEPGGGIEFEYEGFHYQTTSETEVKVISGGNYSGYVTIPETVEYEGATYNVTSIGERAFANCPDLTVLDIHENIQVLEINYLQGNKQSMIIIMRSTNPPAYVEPNKPRFGTSDISHWTLKIPMVAYELYEQQGWIKDWQAIVDINEEAFIPTEFEKDGFHYQTTSETEVVLVQGETEAYYQSEITIPATVEHEGVTYTVTAIGDNAFYGRGLSSVTIPEGVTRMGEYAFGECWSLCNITVLAQIPPTIYKSTFANWDATIYVPYGCVDTYRNAEHWSNSGNIKTAPIIYNGIYYKKISDTEVELIRGETEAYYQSIITIPATVEHEGVTYTVTVIGHDAFAYLKLSSVTIPESVTRMDEFAFGECWELRNITVMAQTPPTIGVSTFTNWDASVSVPEGCVDAYRNAEHWSNFANYKELVPGGGVSFEYEGFKYETLSYTEVELIRGETGAYFQSEITIPATVDHEGVTYTVTAIGNEAFAWRDNLTAVTIPEGVTRMGEYAFADCWQLSNITVLAQTPPTIHDNTFSNWDTSVSVPYGCVETYRNAEHWSNFNNYEESAAPGSGIEFEKDGFYYKTLSYTEVTVTYGGNYSGYVTVPKTVEYEGVTYNVSGIDYEAFGYSPDLTTLDIHENIKYIKNDYLRGNEQVLTIVMRSLNPPMHADPYGGFYKRAWTLTIPYEAHSLYQERGWIGEYKLTYLDGFEPFDFEVDGIRYETISNSKVRVISNTTPYSGNVVVPSVVEYDGKTYNVTAIGDDAFMGSTELTSVTLPEGIATIGKNAFAYCSGLSEITIPTTVTYIGDHAFNPCNNLHTVNILATTPPQIEAGTFSESVMIVVPQGCESVYKKAAHWSNLFASASVGQRIEMNGIVYLILSETEVAMTHKTENIDESYGYEYTGAKNIPSTILYKGNTYNVVAIDSYAFYKAGYCGAVDVPASVTTIGSNAFTGGNDIQFVIIRSTTPPQVESDSFKNGCIIYVPDGCVETYANDKNWKRWKNYIKEMPIIDNGIWYEPISDNEVAVMCNYQACASGGWVCSDYAGDITIPETVVHNDVTYQVTTIGTYAFGYCERLNSITLPATITNIKNRAFLVYYAMDGNYALDTLTVLATTPPQVAEDSFNAYYHTVLCVLNDSYRRAEYWKNFDKIIVKGSGVRFEDNGIAYETLSTDKVAVVAKENGTYSGDIVIPSTVTYEGVTYNVTEIASRAFAECYEVEHVHIENGVETIGSEAFWGCQNMYNINLPLTLKEIGYRAFEYCTSINTLVLPSTLLSIGEGAFAENWAMSQIECNATTPPQLAGYMFYDHVVLYVPEGCVDAYRNAEYWSNITNIKEFPFEVDGLYYEIISDNTAAVMPNRQGQYSGEINIPATIEHKGATYQVTTIGRRAFAHCYDITEFVIPPHITTIEDEAFMGCKGITSITIPASVMSIGNNAFNESGLISVVIEDSDEPLSLSDLCDGSSLFELYLGRNLIYDGYTISSPFPETLTNVTIGDKVTSLNVAMFSACWLQTIKLGKNVTEIADYAFQTCRNLQTIEWNDKVNYIGNYAFYQCNKLEKIELPAGIQTINYATFGECYNLKSVVIPAGVNYITEYAFYQCNNLSSIEVKATTPPTLQNKNIFTDATYNSCQLMVEYGCLDAYKDALYWNEFRHIVERSSDDYFTIDEISASRGSCVTVPVKLINKNVISSFQADLYLPAGIELMKKNGEYQLELSSRATTSHIITAAEQSDGAIRILCYSSQVEALAGNDGDMFSMAIEIASNFNGESYIQMKNIKLISPDDTEHSASELNIELLLTAGSKGDANSDGKVDIADINTVAGYIVSPAGRQINLTQADVSDDGDVNVIDLVGVSNITLGEMAPQAAKARQNIENNTVELTIDNFNMSAGSSYEVAVMLDNSVELTAFQLDIVLPEGLSIQKTNGVYDIALTSRKANHIIQSADMIGNTVRVLAYSASSKSFAENSGELFTFAVVADNNFESGDIEVKNIVFSQKNMTAHKLPNKHIAINGGNSVDATDTDNYTVSTANGHIYIKGANPDSMVYVYSVNGLLVHSTTVANVSTITLQHGVYIVRVNNSVSKVIL